MNTKRIFEVGHSKVTGEYFIVSHDGTETQTGFETKEAAEKAARKAEQTEKHPRRRPR